MDRNEAGRIRWEGLREQKYNKEYVRALDSKIVEPEGVSDVEQREEWLKQAVDVDPREVYDSVKVGRKPKEWVVE